MAAGKSTIGKQVARKLHMPLVDIDDVIAQGHGPIENIFHSEGEPAFRRYEREAIARALSEEPAVLALGGGALGCSPTRQLLRKRAYRVFIKVAPERIFGRLRRARRVRPVLGRAPSRSKLWDLYAARLPWYAEADLTVEATDLKIAEIVKHIVEWMHTKKLSL